jgi:hypothetical protein
MAKLNIAESVTAEKSFVAEPTKSSKDRLQRLIEEETKMVKGRFRCFENPGSLCRIQIRKYKEVPMFDKWMADEGVYEIPLYVARHLNGIDACAEALNGKINSCAYPVHGFKSENDILPASQDRYVEGLGPSYVPLNSNAKYVRRYGFESMEFNVG